MGKVASNSIYNSISNAIDTSKVMVYRIHELSDGSADKFRSILSSKNHDQSRLIYASKCLQEYEEINYLMKYLKTKTYIISGVRDPISFSIAGFFQNLRSIFPAYQILDQKMATRTLSELYFALLDNFLSNGRISDDQLAPYGTMFSYATDYFPNEFEQALGMNIYDHPFDHSKAFNHIHHDRFEVLLYKFEALNRAYAGINQFLNLFDVQLSMSYQNRGINKDYAELYKEFNNNVKFDDKYLSRYYSTQHVQHFYSPEEVDSFYDRWRC